MMRQQTRAVIDTREYGAAMSDPNYYTQHEVMMGVEPPRRPRRQARLYVAFTCAAVIAGAIVAVWRG